LVGQYENLQEQPAALSSSIPFILFTDDPHLRSNTWDVRLVEPSLAGDSVRSARSLKIRGDALIDDFDESLWIDNRVQLRVDPSVIFDAWLAEADLAMFEHSFRDRLIDEFSAVVEGGYDEPARVYEQFTHYAETDPALLDLKPLWTGMIARRKTPQVALAMGLWWSEVEERSRRDQLSAPILLRALENSFAVLRSESNHRSVFHEWPPITKNLGRNHVPLTDPLAVKPVLLRLREAEVAQATLELRIEGYEAETVAWEQKVSYRDDAISHLQGAIDLIRADNAHRALITRDSIIGVQVELATARGQFAELRATHEDVSAGFANALQLLDVANVRAATQRRVIRKLRARLARSREANHRLRVRVREGEQRIKALQATTTWKVGRIIGAPARLFGIARK
jgi:hypothetical protein